MTDRRPGEPVRAEPLSAGRDRRDTESQSWSAPVVERTTPGRVRVAIMRDGSLDERGGDDALATLGDALTEAGVHVWVDLEKPSRDQVALVAEVLRLHPLIVEDVLEGNQRAKIELTDGLIHLILFHLSYDAEVQASEIDIVLGAGFLLTVHDAGWDPRRTNHLRGGVAGVLARGPDHLLWALADDIVDGYFPFADRLGDAIDEVQDRVVVAATPATLEHLFVLKRELLDVRRAVSPVREIFNQLTNRDSPLIDDAEIIYFRDIYDHVIRLTDELDNYRELASATLEVYLTTINNNLSVIMKRLTGVTVILAGVGAVAGVFGMSEAGLALAGGEATGFWIVSGVLLVVAVAAAVVLRRIGWI